MNKQIGSLGFKGFLFTVIFLFIFSNVSASTSKEQNYSLITKNLSAKLRRDLANENVIVKLNNVSEYHISATRVGLKGDASCVLADRNEELPIRFDAKVDTARQRVSDVVYEFDESAYAPTSNEEFLMKELMKKISQDYKTDNIVIAIDDVEDVSGVNNQKQFNGVGEVKIGDLVWNKIKFVVAVDAESKKATKVVYKVEQ